MAPNEQKALFVELSTKHAIPAAFFHEKASRSLFDAAVAAGLIVTDLHGRALAACEEYWSTFKTVANPHSSRPENVVACVGRESLAAKKPKERWTVERAASGAWQVRLHERFTAAGALCLVVRDLLELARIIRARRVQPHHGGTR